MPVHTEFIRAFLTRWETRRTAAYIPCRRRNVTGRNRIEDCGDVIGASGVTVGTGLDLGQQNEADLRRMGLSGPLIRRFSPYLGKRRAEAVAALAAAPLALSETECDACDAAVHADYIRRAAARYDREAPAPFADRPPEAQAVIVSLFYQLGDGTTRYPKTWRLLCAADWEEAADELRTGFSRYANRRADEGRLLERLALQNEKCSPDL